MVSRRAFGAAAATPNVGFIGLGCMGKFMSKNLHKAGYHVKGFDICADTEKFCREAGL